MSSDGGSESGDGGTSVARHRDGRAGGGTQTGTGGGGGGTSIATGGGTGTGGGTATGGGSSTGAGGGSQISTDGGTGPGLVEGTCGCSDAGGLLGGGWLLALALASRRRRETSGVNAIRRAASLGGVRYWHPPSTHANRPMQFAHIPPS